VWRVTEDKKEAQAKTHETLRGATGSGNVAIGPNASSVTNIGNNNAAATTVNVGNTGTSAFGTVNVGRGATAVFIGDNVASAITLGRSNGSVTLGPPLTLGAAPTVITSAGAMTTLGTIYNATVGTGGNIGSGNGFAEITLSPGIYINTFSFTFNYTGTYSSSYSTLSVISGTATLPTSTAFFVPGANANSTTFMINGTFFVSVTATSLIRANANFIGPSTVTGGTNTFWQAIRIG